MEFSNFAKYIFELHYQARDEEGEFIEKCPGDVFDRIARAYTEYKDKLGYKEGDIKALTELQKRQLFSFNSPVYYNLGIHPEPNLAACFVGDLKDSMDSIGETVTRSMLIFKTGAGIGIPIANLRPAQASVRMGDEGRRKIGKSGSSGSCSFMVMFDTAGEVVKAAGKRRAAIMMAHHCEHADVLKFIGLKSGEERAKHLNMNLSVMCTDEFMQAVINDEEWSLGWKDSVWETVKAREVLQQMAENAWKTGDPGILFHTRINSDNLAPQLGAVVCTNPCVPFNTEILTDKGYKQIGMLARSIDKVNVWNGEEFSEVTVRQTGKDQPLVRVHLSDGTHLDCTPDHVWLISDEGRLPAKSLEPGMKLEKASMPTLDGIDAYTQSVGRQAYTDGFFSGDGYEDERGRRILWLYGDKKALLDSFAYKAVTQPPSGDRLFVTLEEGRRKFQVPISTESKHVRLHWLAGLCDADGTVVRYGNSCSIQVSSINREFLLEVRKMLTTLGCQAKVTRSHTQCMKDMPGGTYECQECYRLLINASDVAHLESQGFEPQRLDISENKPNRDARRFVVVESVEYLPVCEDVFCFTEPLRHAGCFEGIVTGNCGEQPLNPDTTCNLGAINLYALAKEWSNDPDKVVKEVGHITKIVMPFLDINIDITTYPHESFRKNSLYMRNVGLGISGFGEMLAYMQLPYDSQEARDTGRKIMEEMTLSAWEWGVKQHNPAPCFADDQSQKAYQAMVLRYMEQSSTNKERWKELYDRAFVEGKYPRNASVTTIAPTGSTGLAFDSGTGGCEPIFALAYTRKVREEGGGTVEKQQFDFEFQRALKELDIDLDPKLVFEKNGRVGSLPVSKDIKNVFKTSHEIHWKDRVLMQAALQKFCTSGISGTVNLPASTTKEEIFELYLLAHQSGCKGITVFRDECWVEGILTAKKQGRKIQDFKRPIVMRGITVKSRLNGPEGSFNVYITINHDESGEAKELFVSVGNSGTQIASFSQAIGRLVSKMLQLGIPASEVVESLIAIRSGDIGRIYLDNEDTTPAFVTSIVDLIAKVLRRHYVEGVQKLEEVADGMECPVCHRFTYKDRGQGCPECSSCHYKFCPEGR